MSVTKIEWAQQTWNPIVGCTIAGAPCKNCYAMRDAYRKQFNPNEAIAAKYDGVAKKTKSGQIIWTGKINFWPAALLIPILRRQPTVYFVNSMSDLFHEDVEDEWIDQILAVMKLCDHHVFQILTKRPERMRRYFEATDRGERIHNAGHRLGLKVRKDDGWKVFANFGSVSLPLANVWLGTSVGDQKAADEYLPHLDATPAAVRWISAEPLIGPVDYHMISRDLADCLAPMTPEVTSAIYNAVKKPFEIVSVHLNVIDWIVCGGESGPGARDNGFLQNARSTLEQCRIHKVPFFGKQGFKKEELPEDLQVRQWPRFASSPFDVAARYEFGGKE